MNVKKVNNSWEYDFRYNKKRYRKRGFKTKKEATIAMNELYSEVTNGLNVTDEIPFIDYFDNWIKVNKENIVSQSTLNRYYNAKAIFDEKFGNTPIKNVSQLKYREMLKEYAEGQFVGGRKEGRTKQSVSKLNNCFSQAFKDALNERLIYRDPTWNAPIYEKKAAKQEESKFMNIDTFKKLKRFSTTKNELSYLAIFILVSTGGRFGEVQKLKYSDINKKENTIHLPGTKTESADRYVTITKQDMKHIQSVLNTRPTPIDKDANIFNTGVTLITNKAVTNTLRKFLLENNAGNYTLHALRHTHASILLGKGFTIQYVSKRLGHANIEITWRVYSHLLEELKSEEDNKLDNALNF
ncbi:site-specific integrase [Staphylococcus gallinarum]|uniref:site-specific integrase n=1 Tax=Staphylococcus gallinarum TaxID=1293 RepID=UPI000D1FD8FF|nr:site-specific integrase [Staphylococcus gallinarum]MCD8819819.1 site-specific integrase [Staphylococcus gallinarum]MCQ9287314.1 site-specific integrase [Staphylococcus gallinarum]PTL06235.1 integrase [Staphylococcus gallinarum]PTL10148.1 integrase [Staphylococcus gallinarum]RIL27845.1 site-specific integrase [Staphylococcus gallinarum]